MIVVPADFKAECSIAQREQPQVSTLIQDFIDKYEPRILKDLLGQTLYLSFIEGLKLDPVPAKWDALKAIVKDIVVNYVYYWYQRNNATMTTGISEAKPKSENAISVSPDQKMVSAWNRMVDQVRNVDLNTVEYPGFVRIQWWGYGWYNRGVYYVCGNPVSEIYFPINVLNT